MTQPKALLFDFGGTLVEEGGVDPDAGNAWLLARAVRIPNGVTPAGMTSVWIGREELVRPDSPRPALIIPNWDGLRRVSNFEL